MSTSPNPLSDTELRLATALAPMLLAVATFSLVVLHGMNEPKDTRVDELFALLSAASLLGSVFVADSILDSINMKGLARLGFLGGGFLLYCIAVGVISMSIPLLCLHKNHIQALNWHYVIFGATGVAAAAKALFSIEKWNWLTSTLCVLYVISIAIVVSLLG